jgi:hypothetical protein
MEKGKLVALVIVVIIIVSGTGMAVLYVNGENARKDLERYSVRTDMQTELSSVQHQIWAELSSVSENLTKTSMKLSVTGLNGSGARAALNDLLNNLSCEVDVVTIDTHGIIVAAEPSIYSSAEGTDISGQSQVQKILLTRMPVMSDVFVMAEGFTATDIEVPVFTAEGKYNGSVSAALDLESMMRAIVNSSVDKTKFQFTCLQTDGLEVYDTDEDQVGRILFTDPVYQNYTTVLTFMHGLVGESNGYGTYEYYRTLESKQLVEKEVYWSSVGLYGVEWRLLLIHAM